MLRHLNLGRGKVVYCVDERKYKNMGNIIVGLCTWDVGFRGGMVVVVVIFAMLRV